MGACAPPRSQRGTATGKPTTNRSSGLRAILDHLKLSRGEAAVGRQRDGPAAARRVGRPGGRIARTRRRVVALDDLAQIVGGGGGRRRRRHRAGHRHVRRPVTVHRCCQLHGFHSKMPNLRGNSAAKCEYLKNAKLRKTVITIQKATPHTSLVFLFIC